jgi:hypothetical protein
MRRIAIVVMSGAAFLAVSACSPENVKSGYVGPASMSQDQVAQLLNQKGFTGIMGLHKNGQDWVGAAQKDGQQVNFDIARDGTIRTN